MNDKTMVDQQEVNRPAGVSNTRYKVKLGPEMYPAGPMEVRIKARGSSQENFLVAAAIDAT